MMKLAKEQPPNARGLLLTLVLALFVFVAPSTACVGSCGVHTLANFGSDPPLIPSLYAFYLFLSYKGKERRGIGLHPFGWFTPYLYTLYKLPDVHSIRNCFCCYWKPSFKFLFSGPKLLFIGSRLSCLRPFPIVDLYKENKYVLS
jgi:hypothetical protein